MRRCLVAGNWKMHGSKRHVSDLLSSLRAELQGESDVDVAVVPPFVYVPQASEQLAGSPIAVGAQDVCEQPGEGAYTGEVSAEMLVDSGCRYVIVGHSERRALYGETDAAVAVKAEVATKAGLTPIVCVGETEDQRMSDETFSVVERQLKAVLDHVGADSFEGAVIAYEPIWAIGTGKTATPEQAQEVHAHIRSLLAGYGESLARETRLIYGGSVTTDNALGLMEVEQLDGLGATRAAATAEGFTALIEAVISARVYSEKN